MDTIEFPYLDDPIQAIPGFEPCCCLIIKSQETRMFALQVTFRASFQPVDLKFYVISKVIDHLAHVGVVLELTIVSLERCPSSSPIT